MASGTACLGCDPVEADRTTPNGELYRRGAATLIASWVAYARGSPGAEVIYGPGVAAAVFPAGPERTVFNNALMERRLGPAGRNRALDAMQHAYAAAAVSRFAVWVHESDGAMCADLAARGFRADSSSRAMGMTLEEIGVPPPRIDPPEPQWSEYVRLLSAAGAPQGLLSGVDPTAFHLVIARAGGDDPVASALAYDFCDDCGIYNVFTLEAARRQGFGTVLTARLLYGARARGCRTASLQSTEVAEGVYRALGFRDLGRILEYVPSPVAG
jgi:GNAT superfamily N-acetyltransferase